MKDVIKSLAGVVEDWTIAGHIPEIDWARMRSMDFQEVLRARNELTKHLGQNASVLCSDFERHVGG